MVEPVRGFKRFLYWILAAFFFTLAMVGVILPGIPTTPFLLLMCYFLLRVSPSLHAKTMAWPFVGGPLRDWRDQGGVRRNVKRLAYTMVTILVGSTLIFSDLPMILKLLILSAAIYGVSVIARLPIARDDYIASGSDRQLSDDLVPASIEVNTKFSATLEDGRSHRKAVRLPKE